MKLKGIRFFFAFLTLFFINGTKLYSMQECSEEEYPTDDYFLGDDISDNPINVGRIFGNNDDSRKAKIYAKCRKTCSFVADPGFKIIVLIFLIAQTIGLYFLIEQLVNSCDKMKDKCDICEHELEKCEQAYELAKSVAQFVLDLWNNCPAGDQDIIEALQKFKDTCCNNTNSSFLL